MQIQKIVFILLLIILSFSLRTSAQIPELIGTIESDTNNTFFGHRIVPLGDQNNDGFDDFITWGFSFKAFLYYGISDLDSILPPLIFDSVNFNMSTIGDINSDGYIDFTLNGRSPVNWKLNLYYGGGAVDTVRDLWFGNDTLYGILISVYTGDINNNGSPEIISRSQEQNSLVIFELGLDSDSIPDLEIYPANKIRNSPDYEYSGFGDGIISGDFNGDGIDDLAVNLRPREQDSLNGQVYLYWGGASFDTIPDMIITRPDEYKRGYHSFGRVLEHLGDVNNDGFDDFFAGSGVSFEDTSNFIYFGGPDIDTIPDIVFTEKMIRVRLAGDLNGDGHNDIITSYPLPFSGSGHINIYYGGSDIDSIPDIHIHNQDMPALQDYFGEDCSGVGDVNGDGIDDFAFSATISSNGLAGQGVIYIFSGPGASTDVEYEYEPNLPDNFTLSQNFPNPFNPSTTIEFQIPQREYVTLSIYNTLGQKIRTLINKELSVGKYSIEWDGKNNGGDKVSSGVYIYKLETSETTLSKKMLLLK